MFSRMSDSYATPITRHELDSMSICSNVNSDESDQPLYMRRFSVPGFTLNNQHTVPVRSFTKEKHPGPTQNRHYSPTASYVSMKSDQSIKPPLQFRQDYDDIESIDKQSSTSTLLVESVQSAESMEPPLSFNLRDSCISLMMREHLRCSLCKYMFKDPVTVPCGHSFCKSCITLCWNKTDLGSSYCCPQCRRRFKSRPVLHLNITLANVVLLQQQVKIAAAFSTHSYAGAGGVACDSCSGNKLKAVKWCQTCLVSFCETHVRQHYTVKALSQHILKDI